MPLCVVAHWARHPRTLEHKPSTPLGLWGDQTFQVSKPPLLLRIKALQHSLNPRALFSSTIHLAAGAQLIPSYVPLLLAVPTPPRYTGCEQPQICMRQKGRHYLPEAVAGHFHAHRVIIGDRHFCRGRGGGSRHSSSGVRCAKPADRPRKGKQTAVTFTV